MWSVALEQVLPGRRLTSALTLVLGAVLLPACGSSGDDTPPAKADVFPDPTVPIAGKSLAEWGNAWWQWLLQLPETADDSCISPIQDPTGADCAYGQSGDVFFLAGNNGGDSVRDECVVPADKPLFFPLVNSISDNAGVPTAMQLDDAALESFVQESVGNTVTSELTASVDGQKIGDFAPYLVPPTKFWYALGPAPNFYTACLGLNAEGVVDPSFQGGYYVVVAPLRRGAHVIDFGGHIQMSPGDFALHVTYHLTVE